MLDPRLQELARKLGEFFLQKNGQDIEKTHNEIYRLGFMDLSFGPDEFLVVTLKSPGRFIGLKGQQVEKIEQFLGTKISVQEFRGTAVEDFILPLPEDEISDDELLDQLDPLEDAFNDFIAELHRDEDPIGMDHVAAHELFNRYD